MKFDMPGAVGFDSKGSVVPARDPMVPAPSPADGPPPDGFVQLSEHDFQKLKSLAKEEEKAMGEAKIAFDRRERFCLELEKKHKIEGMKWTLDAQGGRLVIKGGG